MAVLNLFWQELQNLGRYLACNLPKIVVVLITSTALVVGLLPYVVQWPTIKWFTSQNYSLYIALTLAALCLYILVFPRTQLLWRRYRNTYAITTPPLLNIDSALIFTFGIIVSIFLLSPEYVQILFAPTFFGLFIVFNATILTAFIFITYLLAFIPRNTASFPLSSPSLSDEPITTAAQDELSRGKFINDLHDAITELAHLPNSDPFVIGIDGRWGEGKTSVIGLLLEKLKGKDEFIIVNFDPWMFMGIESMMKAFYEQIQQAISRKFLFTRLKSIFRKYQKLISTGVSNWGIHLDLFPNESLEEAKMEVERCITCTGKKLLVFVDEIDRLAPDEIHMILKLIRANAKFKNTIFVLSYDQTAILPLIGADTRYLEKIIQKPISLPGIIQEDIDKFVDKHLDKLFDDIGIAKEQREEVEKELPALYVKFMRRNITTMRAAKRYLNSLRFSLPAIAKEVNLLDFLLLEYVKVFYDRVHKDIWQSPWYYIRLEWSNEKFLESPFGFGMEDDERRERVISHFNSVVNHETEENKREALKEVLKALFPMIGANSLSSRGDNLKQNSKIAHPDCFRKYFILQVPEGEVPISFVKDLIKIWNETGAAPEDAEKAIRETIANIKEKKQFLKELLSFTESMSPITAERLVNVLYKHIRDFSKKGREDFWNSEFDSANSLMLWTINDRIPKNNILPILRKIVTDSPDIYFAVETVLHCKRDRSGPWYSIYEVADNDELRSVLADRLHRELVQGEKDIFVEFPPEEWGLILYQWATNWTTDRKYLPQVSDYILKLVEKPKNLISLLSKSRDREIKLVQGKPIQVPHGFNFEGVLGLLDINRLRGIANRAMEDKTLTTDDRELIAEFLKIAGQAESTEE